MSVNAARLQEMFPTVNPRVVCVLFSPISHTHTATPHTQVQDILKSCGNNVDKAVSRLLIFGEQSTSTAKPPPSTGVWKKPWEATGSGGGGASSSTAKAAKPAQKRSEPRVVEPTGLRVLKKPKDEDFFASPAPAPAPTPEPTTPPAPAPKPKAPEPAPVSSQITKSTKEKAAPSTRAKRVKRATCHACLAAGVLMWANMAPSRSTKSTDPMTLYLRHLLYQRLPLSTTSAEHVVREFTRLPPLSQDRALCTRVVALFLKAHKVAVPYHPKLLDVVAGITKVYPFFAGLVVDLLLERLRGVLDGGLPGLKERTRRADSKKPKQAAAWGAPTLEGVPSDGVVLAEGSMRHMLVRKRAQKLVAKAHLVGALAGRGLGVSVQTIPEVLVSICRYNVVLAGGISLRIQLACALLSALAPHQAQSDAVKSVLPIFAEFCLAHSPLPPDTFGGVLQVLTKVDPAATTLQSVVENENAYFALIPPSLRAAWFAMVANMADSGHCEEERDEDDDTSALALRSTIWPVLRRGVPCDWSGIAHRVSQSKSVATVPTPAGRGRGRGVSQGAGGGEASLDMAVLDALLDASISEAAAAAAAAVPKGVAATASNTSAGVFRRVV